VIGAASLVALPWVTSGFYSKEHILAAVWRSNRGGSWLWAAGVTGAFITALYTTRMVWLAFLAERKQSVDHRPGIRIQWVLIVLAIFATAGGWLELRGGAEHEGFFARVLAPVLDASEAVPLEASGGWLVLWFPVMVSLAGIAVAWSIYARCPHWVEAVKKSRPGQAIHQLWFEGWGFDWIYDAVIRRPCVWLAEIDPGDVVDKAYTGLARGVAWTHRVACRTQNGSLRRYATGIAVGLAVILAFGLIVHWMSESAITQPDDARQSDGIGAAGEGPVAAPQNEHPV
jgi:NADH-quinone oxidoreductase subunit L